LAGLGGAGRGPAVLELIEEEAAGGGEVGAGGGRDKGGDREGPRGQPLGRLEQARVAEGAPEGAPSGREPTNRNLHAYVPTPRF